MDNIIKQDWSKADHPQIDAFSYMWSLPVMWQRWRLHFSICHSQNPMLYTNLMALFYRTGVTADESFTLWEKGFSTCFAPVSLILTKWPSYTNLTPYSLEIYRMCNYELPTSKLSKVIVRQTDMTEIVYHAALRVVNKQNVLRIYRTEIQKYRK